MTLGGHLLRLYECEAQTCDSSRSHGGVLLQSGEVSQELAIEGSLIVVRRRSYHRCEDELHQSYRAFDC